MKKIILAAMGAFAMFAISSCGGSKDSVVKIGIYEPASGDNGAGGKQETLGAIYANEVMPKVNIDFGRDLRQRSHAKSQYWRKRAPRRVGSR